MCQEIVLEIGDPPFSRFLVLELDWKTIQTNMVKTSEFPSYSPNEVFRSSNTLVLLPLSCFTINLSIKT